MTLSIILPVYNVQNYLNQCLTSIVSQLTEEVELIAINDGSTDNSLDILKEYSKKYTITIICQENKGLSEARNIGLNRAKGSFVWFVDSDDFIDSRSVERILAYTKEKNVDVTCLNTNLVSEDGNYIKTINRKVADKAVLEGYSLVKALEYPFSGAPFYIFRRLFLLENKLFFKPGALYDDWQFILRALSTVEKCQCVDFAPYNYRLRENTISTSKKTFRHLHDCVETAVDYINYLHIQQLSGVKAKIMHIGVCKMIADSYIIALVKMETKAERQKCLKYFFSYNFWLGSIIEVRDPKAFLRYLIMESKYVLGL